MKPCSLLSLATAVPPHVIAQADAKAAARRAFGGRKALFDRLSGVFDNAEIARRHIVAPPDWYEQPHGWSERNALYLEAAEALFEKAAAAAIGKAGLEPGDIDGVVTVSTTGIATPSLEARVGPRLGLRDDIRRVPMFGLGCAGGVGGLATAARLASAEAGTNWLFVTVETCSISIRLDSDDPAAVVATALFGDGAAAAVITSGAHASTQITGSGEKLWPDTQRIMGWDVEDPGLAVIFDRAIPPFIDQNLAPAVDLLLGSLGHSRAEIDRFCCHPGGVKVIDAIESALELSGGELDLEREVLRDFGNMSAPTVLFVLERLIERGLPGRVMMTAFGPGFTCSGLLLESEMNWIAVAILLFVTAERLLELVIARINTQRLVARGGREHGASHYPAIFAVHTAWLLTLWALATSRDVDPFWLAMLVLLLLARFWVIATLGPRWTTRIIVLPDSPLVRAGPYRFLNHPNYWVVIGEIAVLPLVFGLPWVALVFSLLNAAVLWIRIREENKALRPSD